MAAIELIEGTIKSVLSAGSETSPFKAVIQQGDPMREIFVKIDGVSGPGLVSGLQTGSDIRFFATIENNVSPDQPLVARIPSDNDIRALMIASGDVLVSRSASSSKSLATTDKPAFEKVRSAAAVVWKQHSRLPFLSFFTRAPQAAFERDRGFVDPMTWAANEFEDNSAKKARTQPWTFMDPMVFIHRRSGRGDDAPVYLSQQKWTNKLEDQDFSASARKDARSHGLMIPFDPFAVSVSGALKGSFLKEFMPAAATYRISAATEMAHVYADAIIPATASPSLKDGYGVAASILFYGLRTNDLESLEKHVRKLETSFLATSPVKSSPMIPQAALAAVKEMIANGDNGGSTIEILQKAMAITQQNAISIEEAHSWNVLMNAANKKFPHWQHGSSADIKNRLTKLVDDASVGVGRRDHMKEIINRCTGALSQSCVTFNEMAKPENIDIIKNTVVGVANNVEAFYRQSGFPGVGVNVIKNMRMMVASIGVQESQKITKLEPIIQTGIVNRIMSFLRPAPASLPSLPPEPPKSPAQLRADRARLNFGFVAKETTPALSAHIATLEKQGAAQGSFKSAFMVPESNIFAFGASNANPYNQSVDANIANILSLVDEYGYTHSSSGRDRVTTRLQGIIASLQIDPDTWSVVTRSVSDNTVSALELLRHFPPGDECGPAFFSEMKTFPITRDVALHQLWLQNQPGGCQIDWSGRDMSGVNIAGANISGAIMDGADFTGANLKGVVANGVSAREADFTKAILTNVHVDGDGDWTNANLIGAVDGPALAVAVALGSKADDDIIAEPMMSVR